MSKKIPIAQDISNSVYIVKKLVPVCSNITATKDLYISATKVK